MFSKVFSAALFCHLTKNIENKEGTLFLEKNSENKDPLYAFEKVERNITTLTL